MAVTLDSDNGQRVLLYGSDGSSLLKVKTDSSGNLTVIATGSGGVAAQQGDVNNAASAAAIQDALVVARYNATLPTLTDTRFNALQANVKGGIKIELTDADGEALDLRPDSSDGISNNQNVQGLAKGYDFNAVTSLWERRRNNNEGTLLASAVRAATTASADQTNYNARGVIVYLNVTVNPGGAETLAIQVQGKGPVSASYEDLTAFAAILAGGGTGLFAYIVYPGAALTTAVTNDVAQAVPVPRTWRVNVTHSAAGNWTYSVGYALIL